MNDWCVITAGPSAGKSSTIRELNHRGYRTAPEAARILFDQAISEGRDPADVRKDDDFHEQVEAIDYNIIDNMPSDETVFFDRSLADNIAYRRRFGNVDTQRITDISIAVKQSFDYVFLLDRIEFKDDEVRVEDESEAQATHNELRSVYEDLGFDVIEVPVMPVDERADYIEDRIHRVAIH